MEKVVLYFILFTAFFNLIGCTLLGSEHKQEARHLEHVYAAAENHVTFPYRLPHFEDYTIVDMYYVPHEEDGTEETLFITYNANIFITEEMEELMLENPKEKNKVEEKGGYMIYGPFLEENELILPIQVHMKRSPFEIVGREKDRIKLHAIEIEGKEVVYDYVEGMFSHGSYAYFMFEVENEGTYYRVSVGNTTRLSEKEVKGKIKELTNAILS